MKKLLFFLGLSLFLISPLRAQNGELNSEFNFDHYPEVSFVWHEYNPTLFDKTDFSLKENDIEVSLNVIVSSPDSTTIANTSRSFVFLWEDMGCNASMFPVIKELLLSAVDVLGSETTSEEFFLATFNRQIQGQNVLQNWTEGFVTSTDDLEQAIRSVRHSTKNYSEAPIQSDVFRALNESLSLLHTRTNEAKAIVLFTAGRALESSATTSAVMVQQLALKYHIPIYVIQYAKSHGHSTKIAELAHDTYGWNFNLTDVDDNVNAHNGCVELIFIEALMPGRYLGNDYTISYISNAPRNQQTSILRLDIKGNPYTIAMPAVGYTFTSWIQYHIWQSIVIGICVIVLIVLIVVLSILKSKKSAHQMSLLREEQQKAQELAQQQANHIAQMQREAQEAQQRELKNKAQKEEVELLNLMHTKNLIPHLRYINDLGKDVVYEMHKPSILIGRDAEADVQINNKTVSRKHARISFNGIDFVIEDLKSTNGTIVAGMPVQSPHILHNHDVINLGSVLITYYV